MTSGHVGDTAEQQGAAEELGHAPTRSVEGSPLRRRQVKEAGVFGREDAKPYCMNKPPEELPEVQHGTLRRDHARSSRVKYRRYEALPRPQAFRIPLGGVLRSQTLP